MSYVYVIGNTVGHIKIGVSRNIDSRIETLRTGSPFPLQLITAFDADWHGVDAYVIETRAHEWLAPYRLSGEWFHVPKRIWLKALKLAVEESVRPELYKRWARRHAA